MRKELEGDEVFVAEAMFNFMYRFDYEAGGSDQSPVSPLIYNVKVYSFADKDDVPMLKSLARGKLEKAVKTCWNMDDLPHAITEIYSSTPGTDRGLRELEKQNVLEETVDFAADVSRCMASREASKEYGCCDCLLCYQADCSKPPW